MRRRVGIDLADAIEVQGAVETFGSRYLSRVFTPAEQLRCAGSPARLAECLAAKEAVMKLIARADEALPWTSIGLDAGHGTASVSLDPRAGYLARQRGISAIQISVARLRRHAIAVAIAEETP